MTSFCLLVFANQIFNLPVTWILDLLLLTPRLNVRSLKYFVVYLCLKQVQNHKFKEPIVGIKLSDLIENYVEKNTEDQPVLDEENLEKNTVYSHAIRTAGDSNLERNTWDGAMPRAGHSCLRQVPTGAG